MTAAINQYDEGEKQLLAEYRRHREAILHGRLSWIQIRLALNRTPIKVICQLEYEGQTHVSNGNETWRDRWGNGK